MLYLLTQAKLLLALWASGGVRCSYCYVAAAAAAAAAAAVAATARMLDEAVGVGVGVITALVAIDSPPMLLLERLTLEGLGGVRLRLSGSSSGVTT